MTGIQCDGPALLIVALYLDWYVSDDTPAPAGWSVVNELGRNTVDPRTADIHILVLARQVSAAGSYDCPIAVSGSEPQAATSQYFAIESLR